MLFQALYFLFGSVLDLSPAWPLSLSNEAPITPSRLRLREGFDTESERSVSHGLVPLYHIKVELVREACHAFSPGFFPDDVLVVPSVD